MKKAYQISECLAKSSLLIASFLFCATNRANALSIHINCEGMLVGEINVGISGAGISGGFVTNSPMFPTLASAAAKCGEDHFNWYQIVTADNMPPVNSAGVRLTPPYIDPPSGGYGNDPMTGGDDTQWADNLPWYWDEQVPAPGTPGYFPNLQLSANVTANTLNFADFPGGPDGTTLAFITKLASINTDGSLHRLYGGFLWDYVDPVGAQGPSIQNFRVHEVPAPLAFPGIAIAFRFSRRLKRLSHSSRIAK